MERGVELRTERLLLRPFRSPDVDDALAYRDDREFARFLPHIPQPFTRADAEAFVVTNVTERWDILPTFAVVLDGRVIGTVNLEIEPATHTAMLGYAIARTGAGALRSRVPAPPSTGPSPRTHLSRCGHRRAPTMFGRAV